MGAKIHQNYSTEMKAAINHGLFLNLDPLTPTSLWASISTKSLWLWRGWVSSVNSWWRSLRVLSIS